MQVSMSCLNVIKLLNGWHYRVPTFVGNKLQVFRCKAKELLLCKVVKSVTLQLSQYAQHVSLMTLQVCGKLVELHELNELLQCKFTTVLQHFCSGSAADGA